MIILEVGDRVILRDNHPYETGPANPCVGSEWFCEGTISHTEINIYSVMWDNGEWNTYKRIGGGLELVDDMEVCI